jgi:uncharacterized protein (TIGR03382 family)
MNTKKSIIALAVAGSAISAATAAAAPVVPGFTSTGSLSTWLTGAGNAGWANSWIIPSSAPNGNYSWTGQVSSSVPTSATIGDGGFYYAGITASGNGLSAFNPSTLRIDAAGGPVTVTFTFNANVRGIGFIVAAATPPTSVTVFTQGAVASSTTTSIDPAANGGGTGLGFFGAYSNDNTTVLTSVSITLNSGQFIDLTGAYIQLVPAPGAMALLGVAGLVGGRRRR